VISDILYEAGHVIDTNRIYAIGLSNGGMFLTTLLLDPRFRFAAGCVYMGGCASRPHLTFSKSVAHFGSRRHDACADT
jgi:predicted peptidase